MPTCVESAGDDRLWKGVGEKKQVQESGSNEDRSSRRKKGSYPGYLYSSLFFEQEGAVSLFPDADFFFRGVDLLGWIVLSS